MREGGREEKERGEGRERGRRKRKRGGVWEMGRWRELGGQGGAGAGENSFWLAFHQVKLGLGYAKT